MKCSSCNGTGRPLRACPCDLQACQPGVEICDECQQAHKNVSRFLQRAAPTEPPVQLRANSRVLTARRSITRALENIAAENPAYAQLRDGSGFQEALRAQPAELAGKLILLLADELQTQTEVDRIFRALAQEEDRRRQHERLYGQFFADKQNSRRET